MSVRKAQADVTRAKRYIRGCVAALVFALSILVSGISMLAVPVIGATGVISVTAGGAAGWIVGGLIVSALGFLGVSLAYTGWVDYSHGLGDLDDKLDAEIRRETDRILNS